MSNSITGASTTLWSPMPQSPWSDWHRGPRQSTPRPFFVHCQDETVLLRVDENLPAGYDGHLHPSRQYGPPTGRLRHPPDRHLTDQARLPVTRQPCPGDFPSPCLSLLHQCHQWRTLSVPALVDPHFPRISFFNRLRLRTCSNPLPASALAFVKSPWIACEAEGHECCPALALVP